VAAIFLHVRRSAGLPVHVSYAGGDVGDGGSETPVLLGLGANVGDPVAQLQSAVDSIRRILTLDSVSRVYRTSPVGGIEQPDFLNLVCAGRTTLPPRMLLRELLSVEAQLGRVREERNAPRLIDIDLLAYGDQVLGEEDLVVPHPRLHERGFVLAPLLEIAPDWVHPALGGTPADHLTRVPADQRVEDVGRLVT
jgi:2-amino-4-hydroxy-6-hydroxymethyldihydropteridine diphosphokinase